MKIINFLDDNLLIMAKTQSLMKDLQKFKADFADSLSNEQKGIRGVKLKAASIILAIPFILGGLLTMLLSGFAGVGLLMDGKILLCAFVFFLTYIGLVIIVAGARLLLGRDRRGVALFPRWFIVLFGLGILLSFVIYDRLDNQIFAICLGVFLVIYPIIQSRPFSQEALDYFEDTGLRDNIKLIYDSFAGNASMHPLSMKRIGNDYFNTVLESRRKDDYYPETKRLINIARNSFNDSVGVYLTRRERKYGIPSK